MSIGSYVQSKAQYFPSCVFLNCGDTHRDSERAVVDADPKTNNLLVYLLVKNIKRNASRQIEATLFGVNGEVIRKS